LSLDPISSKGRGGGKNVRRTKGKPLKKNKLESPKKVVVDTFRALGGNGKRFGRDSTANQKPLWPLG